MIDHPVEPPKPPWETFRGALFVDLLGFGSMVEKYGESRGGAISPVDDVLQAVGDERSYPSYGNPLGYRYWRFHRTIDSAAEKSASQVMIFSDSALLVRDDVHALLEFARHLMRTFIEDKIAVRMGVARGTFYPVRFRADSYKDVGIYGAG